jgi:hypothetical protein
MPTYRPYETLQVTIPAGSDVSGPIDVSDKAVIAIEVPEGNANTFAIETRSLLNPASWFSVLAGRSPANRQLGYSAVDVAKLYSLGTIRLKLNSQASSNLTVALHLKS